MTLPAPSGALGLRPSHDAAEDGIAMAAVPDIEGALVAHWSQFGRGPVGELHDRDGLTWFETPITHLPYNGVIRTQLAPDAARREIDRAVDRFAARGVDFLWFDHPTASPADLGDRLAAHGLVVAERITCMSLDLAGWRPQPAPELAGVSIRAVRDRDDIAAYTDLTTRYWHIPDTERPLVARLHRGWDSDRAPGVRLLAVRDGEAIGKAYLSLAGPPRVAAIFGMSVVPAARGAGLATGLTTALLRRALAAGCRRVVLHATPAAVALYRRAGFVERCPLTIHATRPLWSQTEGLVLRPARHEDLPRLRQLAQEAIDELQRGFLSPVQIAASHAIMGIDRQLLDDGTYFAVESAGRVVGCGGWSRRATLYGGDHSDGRDPTPLDPACEPARIRAMYTHPDHTRRGIGRMILAHCERMAAAEGFSYAELMSTLAGAPLYRAAGFQPVEDVVQPAAGVGIPLVRMRKRLT